MIGSTKRNLWYLIQARMGSTRLPGKVLMPLGRRTILGSIFHKLYSAGVPTSQIMLVTTDQPRDIKLCQEAEKSRVGWFQGSEFDVLDRFAQATREARDTDIIVRLTADNPFFDLSLLTSLIQCIGEGAFDYVSPKGCAIGSGSEVFLAGPLQQAQTQAASSYQREHVTPFLRDNADIFRLNQLTVHPDRSSYRLTIDTEADYRMATALIEKAGEALLDWDQERICEFLDEHPDIRILNHHVEQIRI